MGIKNTDRRKAMGGLWARDPQARNPGSSGSRVSIVTVCLNSEKHIEQTITSVLGQSYPDIEYIVIDGGSTDGTLDILNKYDDRISCWISEPDNGIFDAMNKGALMATGFLVGFINSDDWYFPYTVEEVVKVSQEDPAAQVIHGRLNVMKEDGALLTSWKGNHEDPAHGFQINHMASFVRRAIFDQFLFRTRYRLTADYDLMLRLRLAGKRFHVIDKPLASFRTGGASTDYYHARAEYYAVRRNLGLLTLRRYIYARLALVFEAASRWRDQRARRRLAEELSALEHHRDDLLADNEAMKLEIEEASRHIEKVEGELARRDTEMARLKAEVESLTTQAAPTAVERFKYYRTNEGMGSALRRSASYVRRRANGGGRAG